MHLILQSCLLALCVYGRVLSSSVCGWVDICDVCVGWWCLSVVFLFFWGGGGIVCLVRMRPCERERVRTKEEENKVTIIETKIVLQTYTRVYPLVSTGRSLHGLSYTINKYHQVCNSVIFVH